VGNLVTEGFRDRRGCGIDELGVLNIIVHDDGSPNGLDERLVGGRCSDEIRRVRR
jgi:hypothetical protein